MATKAERDTYIIKLERLPAVLNQLVAHLNDAQLDTPYRDGGWTVRQVVHHLADSQLNILVRVKLMLTEDNPMLKPYNQDKWAETEDVKNHPIAPSLRIIEGVHDRMTALLRSLNDTQWKRTGNHPERGILSIDDMAKTYSNHGEKHLDHIRGLMQAKGWK
jgi:hypothetical protein